MKSFIENELKQNIIIINIHKITEVDVKLNKWHITNEKFYRKRTETEQIFF